MPKINWKGSVLTAPLPAVLVTCGDNEKPNVLTVAWTGILSSKPPVTYISLRPERHSYDIIKEKGEFVINLSTSYMVRTVDYCGVKSGRDTDKFSDCKLKAEPSEVVSAPSLVDSPLSLECKVRKIIPLGSHDVFVADIVSVKVDDKYIDKKGKLHLEQASLAAYAHGDYFALGKKIGNMGFSVRKKRQRDRKKRN